MNLDSVREEQRCSGCSLVVDILVTRFECREPGCSAGVICTQCFTHGAEFDDHKNDHSYAVLTADRPILDWGWTGAEEIKLLEAIEACGLGNWVDVAKNMGNKSAIECETHYLEHYIYGSASVDISDPAEQKKDTVPAEYFIGPSPVVYRPSKVPLRPELGSVEHSELYAGYCPPRGDFFDEPDPSADKIFNNVYFDLEGLDPLDKKLQMTLVHIYRSRLLQRERIKDIVAEHGLLDASQNAEWIARYAQNFGESTVRNLLPLVQVMSADAFLTFMESLKAAEELKRQISCLQDARANGLKFLDEIPHFKRLSSQRKSLHVKPNQCREVFFNAKNHGVLEKFLQKRFREETSKITFNNDLRGIRKKKAALPPLAIEHLQGYHKLSPPEKEFCSTLRLVPSSFLSMKQQLVAECRKNDGIRLSRAREVCNIDVNKTKRLYDFLISQGMIHR